MRYLLVLFAASLLCFTFLHAQDEGKGPPKRVPLKKEELEEPDEKPKAKPKPKVKEEPKDEEVKEEKIEQPKLAMNQNNHVVLAYNFLKKLKKKDAQNTRFLSYYNYAPIAKETRVIRQKSMSFWVNNLHFEAAPTLPKEVPGSGGLLYYINLEDYGWSAQSFSAVARREVYFREDRGVNSALAVLIRDLINVDQDKNSLHVEAIVRADWLFRETMESDRSRSYYDLLFSKFQNQKIKQKVKGTATRTKYRQERVLVDYGNYRQYEYRDVAYQESYETEEEQTVTKRVAFPRNEADFELAFGVDQARRFVKDFKINTQHGAVVEGGEKGVSIVARQNRLIERTLGFAGAYYKTYDVKETSGDRDFAETLQKNFKFDAGEILADLPGGGMAALLVDANGKIVEVADNRFATDNSDIKLDARVRTPGSCFICHESRYIKPKDLVKEMLEAGIDIKVKGKKETLDTRAFFLRWDRKLKADQSLFEGLIEETSGFTPGQNATKLKEWRDEYDAPVNLAVALAETGLSKKEFEYLANKSPKVRMKMIFRGLTIPRRTWETDTFKETMQLYEVHQE